MKNLLILVMVVVGFMVAAMSIYTASIGGVMGKMGLVGGDFQHAIDQNKLARETIDQSDQVDCGLLQIAKKVPNYLFSKGQERVVLASKLGGERIVCGIRLVRSGNVERGVYTIVKGLYYHKSHYEELRILVQEDNSKCKYLADDEYENKIEGYLGATEGRIHEVVNNLYKQVGESKARVQELCID